MVFAWKYSHCLSVSPDSPFKEYFRQPVDARFITEIKCCKIKYDSRYLSGDRMILNSDKRYIYFHDDREIDLQVTRVEKLIMRYEIRCTFFDLFHHDVPYIVRTRPNLTSER